MGKKLSVSVLFLTFLICFLCGCQNSGEKWKSGYKLKFMSVTTAAENPANISLVEYPNIYKEMEESFSLKETAIPLEELPEDVEKYLWNYIVNVESADFMEEYTDVYGDFRGNYKELYEGHEFTCELRIVYEDSFGKSHEIIRYCFDEFPEGWSEFVKEFNDICGGEYLTDSITLQEVTPEYMTAVTGLTDEDINGGTLQEFIDYMNIDMFDLAVEYRWIELENDADEFYRIKHLPKELRSEESNFQEFYKFVTTFLRESYSEGAFDYYDIDFYHNGAECRVWVGDDLLCFFRSECVDEDYGYIRLEQTYEYGFDYYIEVSYYEEGASLSTPFYYNADGKYGFITDTTNQEILEAFFQAK